MSTLSEMYVAACMASDPLLSTMRAANHAGVRAQQLENSTLESGAMPGDFKVMLVYRLGSMTGTLTPVLR